MAADFPTSLHDFSATYANEDAQEDTHPGIHNDLNEELAAVQVKVGVDSSAVNTTHDFKLSGVSDGDYAVSRAGTETLTNKTLTSPTVNTPNVNEAVALTSTSTELNLADGSIAGTAVASKLACLGSNKELDEFHTAALYLGAGAGTQVTATAAELNITDNGQTTEKVLNVQSKCHVTLSGAQSITNDSYVKIQFDTETWDIGSDYDTTNHRFTAPVTGYYAIAMSIEILNIDDAGAIAMAAIYVNGTNVAEHRSYVHAINDDPTVNVATIHKANSGEYIEFYCYQSGSGPDNTGTAAYRNFGSVHLLSI